VALSSLVEGLSLKVTGIKCPQTSDDSLFANGRHIALCIDETKHVWTDISCLMTINIEANTLMELKKRHSIYRL